MPVIHPAAPQLLLEDLARPLASSEDRVGFAKRFADEHPHGCPPCSFEATDGTVAA